MKSFPTKDDKVLGPVSKCIGVGFNSIWLYAHMNHIHIWMVMGICWQLIIFICVFVNCECKIKNLNTIKGSVIEYKLHN